MTRLVRIDNTPIVLIAEDDDDQEPKREPRLGLAIVFVELFMIATVVLLLLRPWVAR